MTDQPQPPQPGDYPGANGTTPLPRWTILPGDPPALRRELARRQADTDPGDTP